MAESSVANLAPGDGGDAPYGFCPHCGCKGKTRERRPNGNDSCFMGHSYPSATALGQQPTDLATLVRHVLQRFEDTRTTIAASRSSTYDDGYVSALEWAGDDLRRVLFEAERAVPQSLAQRVEVLEREVRRLNNAIRHMKEERSRGL